MTAPGAGVPDGANTPASVGGMQHMTEASIMAGLRAPVDTAAQGARLSFWDVLGMVATALFGPGPGAALVRLADGMTELNSRIDLMTQVSGYGGMIMSNNHRFTGSAYKTIPFNTQYGPTTPSVSLDTVNHRIYLARGTWSINLLLSVPQSGPLGGDTWMRPAIRVHRPDGSEYLTQWLDWRSGVNPHAYYAQIPLIVPNDDGFYVEALFTQDSLNFPVLGGTDRSKFWVNRWDLRTDNNNIIIDPPNGPDV